MIHIEKNICDSIIGTMLNLKEKSKDGLKSCKDLRTMKIRNELHPLKRGLGFYLSAAFYGLSKKEKEIFLKRHSNMRLLDGHGSNFGNPNSIEESKILGLKSHDYHILMQQILYVALRELLPKGPTNAIIQLCAFFNQLCHRSLDRNKLESLEKDVAKTLCLLEIFFPLFIFDIMVHVVIHLG